MPIHTSSAQSRLGFFAVQFADGTRFWAVGQVQSISIDTSWDESGMDPFGGPDLWPRVSGGQDLTTTLHNVRWHIGDPPPGVPLEDLARIPGAPSASLPAGLRQIGSGGRP